MFSLFIVMTIQIYAHRDIGYPEQEGQGQRKDWREYRAALYKMMDSKISVRYCHWHVQWELKLNREIQVTNYSFVQLHHGKI